MKPMAGQMASDHGVEGGDLQTLFGTDAQVAWAQRGSRVEILVGQLDLIFFRRIGTRWAPKVNNS